MQRFMKKEDKRLIDVDKCERFATTSAQNLKFVFSLSPCADVIAVNMD